MVDLGVEQFDSRRLALVSQEDGQRNQSEASVRISNDVFGRKNMSYGNTLSTKSSGNPRFRVDSSAEDKLVPSCASFRLFLDITVNIRLLRGFNNYLKKSTLDIDPLSITPACFAINATSI